LSVDTTNNTNVCYKIDDGTGIIDVKVWHENDDSGMTQVKDAVEEGTYVRVYGHLRQWQKSLNVVAFRLKQLDSFDEVTYHFLEVIRVHLHHTKGPLPAGTAAAGTPIKVQNGLHGGPSPSPVVKTESGTQQFNQVQTAILSVISQAGNKDLGAHKNAIYTACTDMKLESQSIAHNLEWLVSEGHVFTTMDDDHYATSIVAV